MVIPKGEKNTPVVGKWLNLTELSNGIEDA